MTATPEDYDLAVRAFWQNRDLQTQKQIESGRIDAGTRGSVTGGTHLHAIEQLLVSEFAPLLEMGAEVRSGPRKPLPGFYRIGKDWDVVITYKGILVAAIECKSQVGSFGNNFNNRTEEAIGSAVDLRHAFKMGLLGSVQPWLGFFFILEDSDKSNGTIKAGSPIYPIDPIFENSSYTRRYQILFERLVQEQHYDAACLVSTRKGEGILHEPIAEVSTRNFSASIAGRVEYIRNLA